MRGRGAVAVVVAGTLGLGGCDGGGEEPAGRPCPERRPVTRDEGYPGVLLDAWTEMGTADLPSALACAMDEHEVEYAALATAMDPTDTFTTESAYRAAVAGREARFLPFMELPRLDDTAGADVERVVREVGVFFRGVAVPDLRAVPESLLTTAASRDLFVAGPIPSDIAALTSVLEAYPDTKVLALVPRPVDGLASVLRAHSRLFVVALRPALADVDAWLAVIQASPERVMWGSGAMSAADAAPDAYARVVQQVRGFTGRLPPPMQHDFAGANARRLFGAPEPPEPDV